MTFPYDHDPRPIVTISESFTYEEMTGHTFRSPTRDAWPAALKDLQKEFEKGRLPRGASDDEDAEVACRVCSL